MVEKFKKIQNSRFGKVLKEILMSKYFPFITAAISILCYYLSWDIVFIYFICIVGLIILLFLEDISPFITLLLFMSILVSYKNSPSNLSGNSNYYSNPAILVQVFIVIGALSSGLIYRIILACIKKHFSLSPIFWGLCGFSAILLMNGLFSADYNPKNLLYGFIMALCFLGIFTALKDNIQATNETFERIALSLFALSIVLIIELTVTYLTIDGLYVDGNIIRQKLSFGWGMWNTMGMMLIICLPAVFYLAGKYKYGFIFTLFSTILLGAIWLSCSRQAMLGSLIIYPSCLIILFIKGNNRLANVIFTICATVAILVLILIYRTAIFKYFNDLIIQIVIPGEYIGNGRMLLWKGGIEYFKSAPFLGIGFYSNLYNDFQAGFTGFTGMSFIPPMCHNTIVQIMSACGIMGLLTYAIHRVQTILSFFNSINFERTFIALTILALIGVSLVDNHMFNIFPTIIYSCLLAILIASEKPNKL